MNTTAAIFREQLLFPVGSIDEQTAQQLIPDKDTLLLVYCRSGNRSKTAAAALAKLGYTQVYEFGESMTGRMILNPDILIKSFI